MTDATKTAIDAGDVDALRALVAADRALADADVRFGPDDKHAVPPLHDVCDAVFRKAATQESGRSTPGTRARTSTAPACHGSRVALNAGTGPCYRPPRGELPPVFEEEVGCQT